MKRVILTFAASLMLLQVGCATTSYKHFEHSTLEVDTAQRQTEEEALARMASSPCQDVADAAHEVSLQIASR